MNLYLLEMFLKFLRMIFVAFVSLFNITLYTEDAEVKENYIVNADKYAVRTVVLKEEQPVSKVVAISKKSTVSTKKTVIKNNTSTTKTNGKTLSEYTGRLTGYGPDCVGCSKVGNVACRTREKKAHSLIKDGIYYNDKQYGKVRILAAATSKFKCGTIVVVKKPGMQPFTGIVLDTGGSMRQAWAKGNVWMDLAYSSNAMAGSDNLTGTNIKFSVQRWVW